MPTSLAQAWSSLQSGEYRQARESFRNAVRAESDEAYAFLGLASVSLATGNLRDALSFGRKSLESSETPEANLLLGEVHSRLGNRQEAESYLQSYFRSGGDSPYARALLGEQRIRTARWDEGIEDYLRALDADQDRHAFRQLQRVLTDLTEAVASGRLPPKPAAQFLRRIHYNAANVPPEAEGFFTSVRQAINTGSRLSDPDTGTPIFELLGTPQLPDHRPGQRPVQAERLDGETESTTDETSSGSEIGIDPKQKDLAVVIQDDRRRNEALQESIGSMPPPDWPSEPEGEIDPLPRMAYEEQSIFAGQPGMDATDFRITSGSVRAEIFLERCLQNLMAAAKQDRAISVRFRPEAITRIEINCWDGLLGRLPDLSPIYDEFHEAENYEELAVGRFIGECVATPYDGTWDFKEPPENSKLIIGKDTLDPFQIVRRWRDASDPDEVSLEVLASEAARASQQSTSLTVEQNYIDPTRELEGHSLSVKLAELWAGYLFRIADESFAELAQAIEPLESGESVIIFGIDAEYAPDLAAGPDGAARLEGGKVPLAYLRETGEFLVLASRKHAARCAARMFDQLTAETAKPAARFLANYHRPGWSFIGDGADASRLSRQIGADLDPPQFKQQQGRRVLEIEGVAGQTAFFTALQDSGQSLEPWKLEISAYS